MENSELSSVAVAVKPDFGDIFAYKIYDAFVSVQGVFRLLISAAFLALGIATFGKLSAFLTVAVFVLGILNPIVSPVMFAVQAASAAPQQLKTSFVFNSEGFSADNGKGHVKVKWEELALFAKLRRYIFIYTDPRKAFILPVSQLAGHDGEICTLAKSRLAPGRQVFRKLL